MATHSSVLPGEPQGWGSLVGCRLWGHTESNTTEVTQQQQQQPLNTTVVEIVRISKEPERILLSEPILFCLGPLRDTHN